MIAQVRYAQPTANLEKIEHFYGDLLRLPQLSSFVDHDGYSGIMFGLPDARVHLEFTQALGHATMPSWDSETLLVFYIPDVAAYDLLLRRLDDANSERTASSNPYWDRNGVTFVDPDGRRVVIYNNSGLTP
jgi:hypothetical protein